MECRVGTDAVVASKLSADGCPLSYRALVVNGNNATCRARLMATVRDRWCLAQVPSFRRG